MKMTRAESLPELCLQYLFFFFSFTTTWLVVALLEVFILFIIILGCFVALLVFLIFLRNDLL